MKNKETKKMKADKLKILKGYEENIEEPVNGLEQLHKIREETANRWKESGLLEGLTGNVSDNVAKMFESKPYYIINENNKNFSRVEVIDILDEFAFFLSDNGNSNTTAKEWLDMKYPKK